jgi:hypothetical protein
MKDRVESVLTIALCLILIAVPGLWLYDALYGSWLDVPVEAGPEPERARPTTYQVMPGDSLWSVYVTYYKGCDWDEVRYKIGQANGLKNDRLYPYEVIKLPGVS